VGVRQADREEMYRPFGVSDEVWERRSRQARGFAMGNFALYNAPPGTWQRMAAYYYLSPEPARATQEKVMQFTHDDTYKPIPGFQVAVSHFHTHFHEQVLDAGSLDFQPPWIPTFRELGINIAMMSDFHGDGHANDPGPLRLKDQKAYFDASRRHSDRDFLIIPGEENRTLTSAATIRQSFRVPYTGLASVSPGSRWSRTIPSTAGCTTSDLQRTNLKC
jgi:hypothetical protein